MTVTFSPRPSDFDSSESCDQDPSPVLRTAVWATKELGIVALNEKGIASAAKYIHEQLESQSYTPRTWRTHPLHLLPAEPFSESHPSTRACLDWIFLISCLNFSFWSEKDDESRYGVEWREGWDASGTGKTVHTGYWSLVAAVDRALDEGIRITDPAFYADPRKCPDTLIQHVFRPAARCTEEIPLLRERIAILREVGSILCAEYGGSFHSFIQAFQRRHNHRGTALQLVRTVTDTFPSFRDETVYKGHTVYLWKRAQILVAETWAAFYPPSPSSAGSHPLFPAGAAIHELTMFADYRVPQILHHLRILAYPPTLVERLAAHAPLAPGSAEELSIRAASIVAVERVRREILESMRAEGDGEEVEDAAVSSVLIDFYLWDLAKSVESGEKGLEGVETQAMLPIHRTRSIWY